VTPCGQPLKGRAPEDGEVVYVEIDLAFGQQVSINGVDGSEDLIEFARQ
jgi:hypothetical protein